MCKDAIEVIELVLSKIAVIVLKKAAVPLVPKLLSGAIEIYSVFQVASGLADCVECTNDCRKLAVCGLKVISPRLAEAAVDRLVNLGSTAFEIRRTRGGLFIASSLIPQFALNPDHFPKLAAHPFPKLAKKRFPKFDNE